MRNFLFNIAIGIVLSLVPGICFAQANYPHVNEVVKQLDADGDGIVTTAEAAKSRRYKSQFSRWDTDKDGKVSAADITKMRAKYGIAADGTMIGPSRRAKEKSGQPKGNGNQKPKPFTIPDVADLVRKNRKTALTREQASNSQFVIATKDHPVSGENYLVLTDHTDEEYLKPLRRLVEHRKGELFVVKDFANFNVGVYVKISQKIRNFKAKFVAVAPRRESFSENMVLSIWATLSSIDKDPELDCYPGFLVASNSNSFSRLIDQSIAHKPISTKKLKPFAISQVQNSRETRSLQKSGILRKHFKTADIETPIVAIYGKTADAAPRLSGEKVWNLKVDNKRRFIKEFPADAQESLDSANLVILHGHGIPGMSCSMDVDGLPSDCSGKILMSGSCFSACPSKPDYPMNQAPGGYQVEQRDAFVMRAIDNGAVVAFGHQRLSSGFPHLYPALESWMKGESVGEGYQELMNALIDKSINHPSDFMPSEMDKDNKYLPQNSLLYVVIGDPALVPFEPQPLLK